jgi:hypothetical protein
MKPAAVLLKIFDNGDKLGSCNFGVSASKEAFMWYGLKIALHSAYRK